jgi:tRNA(His) 5'-end guanylyltransferase
MDTTAIYLCENIQGAKFAYTQSDEITIVMTDLTHMKPQLGLIIVFKKMVIFQLV